MAGNIVGNGFTFEVIFQSSQIGVYSPTNVWAFN